MSNVIYFPNLKASGFRPTATGTQVTDAALEDHACMDVFARNDASNPLFVSGASVATILAQDIHSAAATTVNGSAGAYVALGAAVTIPAGTKSVQISSTMGEPVEISFAANSGAAAASVAKAYLVAGGAPGKLDLIPGANNKAFIKSLSTTSITDGYVTLIFMG